MNALVLTWFRERSVHEDLLRELAGPSTIVVNHKTKGAGGKAPEPGTLSIQFGLCYCEWFMAGCLAPRASHCEL